MFKIYLSVCLLLVICGVVTRKMASTDGEMKSRPEVRLVLVDENYEQNLREEA